MIEFIIQAALFALIGSIVGIFGTLLFFRMDTSWKQVGLGFLGVFSAGGSGLYLIDYLDVPAERVALILLILTAGLMISVYKTFLGLCKSLKEQTGNNIIRVLDIIVGYDGFLKDYYEMRKKNVDKEVELDEINSRKAKLDSKEKYLLELQKEIEEQKKNCLTIKLPEYGEMAVTDSFIKKIPFFISNICKFTKNVEQLTNNFLGQFTGEKNRDIECLKGYFAGVGMYVASDLFGTTNDDVRTHFRILKSDLYVQYTVVVGTRLSSEKITDIPRGDYLIEKSFELKRSLVASLNPGSYYDTKSSWEDFMTITYYNLTENGKPFLSMGISIKYSEQFRDMLYFLNYYKIENCLQKLINKINEKCDIVSTLK